jgi:hypothetical protein
VYSLVFLCRYIRDYIALGCTVDAVAGMLPIPVTVAQFGVGDAFIFRPDLIHAGDAFDEENVRSHCFLDSTTLVGFKRRTNGTFIPSDDVGEQMLRLPTCCLSGWWRFYYENLVAHPPLLHLSSASKEYAPLAPLFLPHLDDERRFAGAALIQATSPPAACISRASPPRKKRSATLVASPLAACTAADSPQFPNESLSLSSLDAEGKFMPPTHVSCAVVSAAIADVERPGTLAPVAKLRVLDSVLPYNHLGALLPLPPPRVARYFGDPASVFCEPDCHYRSIRSDYFCCG